MSGLPSSPLRPAVGPHDYEALGRERYWEAPPERRSALAAQMMTISGMQAVLREPEKRFALGWLAEHDRVREFKRCSNCSSFLRPQEPGAMGECVSGASGLWLCRPGDTCPAWTEGPAAEVGG